MFTRFSAFYTPLIATMAAGFLQEEGLEPSYAIADGTKTLRSGLADGSVHMGQSAVSSSWAALDKGQTEHVVHFAQLNLKDVRSAGRRVGKEGGSTCRARGSPYQ